MPPPDQEERRQQSFKDETTSGRGVWLAFAISAALRRRVVIEAGSVHGQFGVWLQLVASG